MSVLEPGVPVPAEPDPLPLMPPVLPVPLVESELVVPLAEPLMPELPVVELPDELLSVAERLVFVPELPRSVVVVDSRLHAAVESAMATPTASHVCFIIEKLLSVGCESNMQSRHVPPRRNVCAVWGATRERTGFADPAVPFDVRAPRLEGKASK